MYLVRHAPTPANSGTQIVRGQTNVPVDDKGIEIADLRARRFMDTPVSLIRSADDDRTSVMAEALQRYTGAPIEYDYRLNSWDMGDLEGLAVTPALKAKIYEYMTSKAREWVPGGEPYSLFLARLIPYIKEVVDQEEFICVTHFRSIMAIMAWDAAGRDGLMQDPQMLKRDAYIDQCQVVLMTPDECVPIIQEEMRSYPEAI